MSMGNAVIDQRHPVMKLLPRDRDAASWIVANLVVDELSKTSSRQQSVVVKRLIADILSCLEGVVFKDGHADGIRVSVVGNPVFGDRDIG